MSSFENDVRALSNATILDETGEKSGRVDGVYLDRETDQPVFVRVKFGFLRAREAFVPVQGLQRGSAGLIAPYSEEFIRESPRVDDARRLSLSEESELYAYYGMAYTPPDIPSRGETEEPDRVDEFGTPLAYGSRPTDTRMAGQTRLLRHAGT